VIAIERDQTISRTKPLHSLVQSLYSRTEADFTPGNFRIKGDTVEVYPSYADDAFEFIFLAMK
jgi:excinuclease ABC subunit B